MNLSIFFFTLLLTAVSAVVLAASSSIPQVYVQIDPTLTPASKPARSDFASFSVEVPCAPKMIKDDATGQVRTAYINLMKYLKTVSNGDLGPNLRIGGNSADETYYVGNTSTNTPIPPGDNNRVTNDNIESYSMARKGWGGTVTPDLSLRNATNPSNAAAYAAACWKYISDPEQTIDTFEIGNECDLFGGNGIRPKNYSYDEYNAEFQRELYALELNAKIPMPLIQGATWATMRWGKELPSYIKEYAPQNNNKKNAALKTVSLHHYPFKGSDLTVELLLSPHGVDLYGFTAFVDYCEQNGVIPVIGEGNSGYDGGKLGVSNAAVSAFWGLDNLLNAMKVGLRRWNFHGCVVSAYTPISCAAGRATAHPLYYGMLAFTSAVRNGATYVKSSIVSDPSLQNVGVHAVATQDAIRLVGITKDASPAAQNVSIAFSFGNSVSRIIKSPGVGKVYWLKVSSKVVPDDAPAIDKFKSLSGMEFGGQTFDNSTNQNAAPSGVLTFTTVNVDMKSGDVAFIVPPATAFVAEFERI